MGLHEIILHTYTYIYTLEDIWECLSWKSGLSSLIEFFLIDMFSDCQLKSHVSAWMSDLTCSFLILGSFSAGTAPSS